MLANAQTIAADAVRLRFKSMLCRYNTPTFDTPEPASTGTHWHPDVSVKARL